MAAANKGTEALRRVGELAGDDDGADRAKVREGRARDRERGDDYRAGQRDARRAQRERAARRASSSTRKHLAPVGRRTVRSATGPVVGTATSAAGLFGIALALVALYLVLTSAQTVARILQLARHAIGWVVSPHKSIPYAK